MWGFGRLAALDTGFGGRLAVDGFVDRGEGFGGVVLEFEGVFPAIAVFADVFGELERSRVSLGVGFLGRAACAVEIG